jgi:signal transduction histidine kinase
MTQSRRYVLLFTAFVGLSTFAMALVSARAIGYALSHFAAAPNKELAATLWQRMAFDMQVSLFLAALGITAVAVPAGIGLWRLASRRHRGLLRRIESLAQERLGLEGREVPEGPKGAENEEERIWEDFAPLLIGDLERIRDREKAEAWKEGARMLMHELKNPMTPLKLSAQRLALDGADAHGPVGRILEATESMERILGYFKGLVNVEFGPKEAFTWREYLDGVAQDWRNGGKAVTWSESYYSETVIVNAERTLLRMVMDNLANNGSEACPGGISVRVAEKRAWVEMEFSTPGARLSDPERIFRAGHSTKGKGRGYGLFLCKTISDYLDLGLWFRQDPQGVVFGMRIPKPGFTGMALKTAHASDGRAP